MRARCYTLAGRSDAGRALGCDWREVDNERRRRRCSASGRVRFGPKDDFGG